MDLPVVTLLLEVDEGERHGHGFGLRHGVLAAGSFDGLGMEKSRSFSADLMASALGDFLLLEAPEFFAELGGHSDVSNQRG